MPKKKQQSKQSKQLLRTFKFGITNGDQNLDSLMTIHDLITTPKCVRLASVNSQYALFYLFYILVFVCFPFRFFFTKKERENEGFHV